MNSRERVLRAFKRIAGLPDRVPVQFELCAVLYEHFSRKLGIPMHYTRPASSTEMPSCDHFMTTGRIQGAALSFSDT
jgi:hypothetical protein